MASGHLRTILPREIVSDGQIPPIKVTDINELMDRLLRRAEPLDRIPAGCSNMRFVARAIRGRLAEVHQLILDGKVWTGRLRSESLPYASIVVNPSEVRAALGGAGTLSSAEMSIASGLPKCVLAAMCTSGKIEFISGRNGTTGKLRRSFSHETLNWVREELVSLTRLARRLRRQPRTLGPALSAMGIQPYCAVQSGHRNHTVYQKRDVSHLLP